MFVDLVEMQRKLNLPINSLQVGFTGGALLSPQIIQDIRESLNLTNIRVSFVDEFNKQ